MDNNEDNVANHIDDPAHGPETATDRAADGADARASRSAEWAQRQGRLAGTIVTAAGVGIMQLGK